MNRNTLGALCAVVLLAACGGHEKSAPTAQGSTLQADAAAPLLPTDALQAGSQTKAVTAMLLFALLALLLPGQDRAVAVACNCYGGDAVDQLDRLVRQLALDERR